MISLRIRWPYGGEEWTEVSVSGSHEEVTANILGSAFLSREWEVWISQNGGEEFMLGEDEPHWEGL